MGVLLGGDSTATLDGFHAMSVASTRGDLFKSTFPAGNPVITLSREAVSL